jgi:hypothetical protein
VHAPRQIAAVCAATAAITANSLILALIYGDGGIYDDNGPWCAQKPPPPPLERGLGPRPPRKTTPTQN